MSDTFFVKNKNSDIESAKAVPPMTNTNISSDNYMIEDSMNIEVDEPCQDIFEDYNKLKYEFYKLQSENEGLKKNFRKVILLIVDYFI